MIIGENRVVERGGMLTACGGPALARRGRELLIDVINKGPFGPLHVFGIR
jgi:hypothetical protein